MKKKKHEAEVFMRGKSKGSVEQLKKKVTGKETLKKELWKINGKEKGRK